jgi:glycosyltransferase involved in cell wall biosynthesis
MKIAIDVRDLRLATTGTKTYLQELLFAIKKQSTSELIILELGATFLNTSNPSHKLFSKLKQHLFTILWKQFVLPYQCWRLGAQVLISTDYMLPLLPCKAKKIVVFHDALFFDHPEYYPSLWLTYFKWTALWAAHHSAAIVTTSFFSKQRLLSHFPAWESKLHVIYQGPKSWPPVTSLSNEGQKLLDLIDSAPFFLHVGSMEKRKNLPFLIHAFSKLPTQYNAKLVLVGVATYKKNSDDRLNIEALVRDLKLEHRVLFAGYLSDSDLPFFYKSASAYVYPSLYEGFGIPILEAFHHQLPVAIAKGSSLVEVAGDAAIQFDPTNSEALTKAMDTLLNNSVIRAQLIQKGLIQKNNFNWDIAASDFVTLARELLFLPGS